MNLFKKKENLKLIRKMIDEANYIPEGYYRTKEYVNFRNNSRKKIKEQMDNFVLDEHSPKEGLVVHSEFDAKTQYEKTSCVEPQYIRNLQVIDHQSDVYRGSLRNLELQEENLLKDREFYTKELENLISLNKELNSKEKTNERKKKTFHI